MCGPPCHSNENSECGRGTSVYMAELIMHAYPFKPFHLQRNIDMAFYTKYFTSHSFSFFSVEYMLEAR